MSWRGVVPVGPKRIDSPVPKLFAETEDHVQNSSFADGPEVDVEGELAQATDVLLGVSDNIASSVPVPFNPE